jgi:hypothetical protein
MKYLSSDMYEPIRKSLVDLRTRDDRLEIGKLENQKLEEGADVDRLNKDIEKLKNKIIEDIFDENNKFYKNYKIIN